MLINDRHAEFSLLYDPNPITPGDTLLLFRSHEVLLRTDTTIDRLPVWSELAPLQSALSPLHVFSQGTHRFFLASTEENTIVPDGFAFEGVRVFRSLLPLQDGTLLNAAYHLSVWYHDHRFCGVCGSRTTFPAAERALTCQRCGHTIFPTISPAVIVAITNGSKLLLARNAQGTWRHFSLIAGYVEVGETAEQAVRREINEEVGLQVKNIRYIASQPWGFSQSLMLGFTAELNGAAEICLQESELSEAHWFSRDEVPRHDSTSSIAYDLMEQFRHGAIGRQE